MYFELSAQCEQTPLANQIVELSKVEKNSSAIAWSLVDYSASCNGDKCFISFGNDDKWMCVRHMTHSFSLYYSTHYLKVQYVE